MAKLRQIQKSKIDFGSVMNVCQEATMERFNCHNIGRITEFDSATQTCTIELMQLKQFSNQIIIPAPLTEVPLIIYGCGDATITLPNPVGTTCLVLFLDRNMDAFMQTGEQYVPETSRMHDFTDCVAITTFKTLVNPIENYDETSISINYQNLVEEVLYYATIKNFGDSLQLKVKDEDETKSGVVSIDSEKIQNSVEGTTTGDVSIEADKVNISVVGNELSANIQVDTKIQIQNTAQNMLLVMTALIEAIKAITITNNAVSTASKNALDAITTQFGELLE